MGIGKDTPQVDLVSTLAVLLGVPIPFNNLGRPIEGVFGGDWRRLVEVNLLAAAQMGRFVEVYEDDTKGERVWGDVDVDWEDEVALRELYARLREYQGEVLEGYRRVWTRFQLVKMVEGVLVLVLGVVALLGDGGCVELGMTRLAGVIGIVAGAVHVAVEGWYCWSVVDGLVLGAALGSLVSCIWQTGWGVCRVLGLIWEWQAVVFTLLLSIGFASNSYTVWEDRVILFFLSTFGLCSLSGMQDTKSLRQGSQSMLFMMLNRIVSLSRACREEQLPFCRTSFYRLESNAVWRLSIPFLTAAAVLYTTNIALQSIGIRKRLWFATCIPVVLVFNTLFWTLETANEQDWLADIVTEETSKTIRTLMAQSVLVIALVGLGIAFKTPRPESRTLILTTAVLLASILVSSSTGGLSLAILYHQLISLRRLVPDNTIKPTIAALLGTLHFFSTGHNATFSSIQWKAAYIAFHDRQPLISPLLVILNTFAAPIISACAVPLLSPESSSTAKNPTARLLATHSTVYAVWAVSTALWACLLRRHLMLFAIFCPRFLLAGGLMLIVDILALLSSILLAR
ncbi:hypothetical protein BO71DRAFT_400094 [Aspergillus ellipticus CBS 707.79]|uniref:GPI ethanolamine phosphate transferase 2 C-terminal domain-containing protein n=1 Tax=Aspergillus ellipticus CBS 707.79 TaxID=1448320 RepID=A0A319D717_9EURO|nr:hypothetical protein BO71DRAFT_400094 [Aspergillus ellipticus CBS 707.79]